MTSTDSLLLLKWRIPQCSLAWNTGTCSAKDAGSLCTELINRHHQCGSPKEEHIADRAAVLFSQDQNCQIPPNSMHAPDFWAPSIYLQPLLRYQRNCPICWLAKALDSVTAIALLVHVFQSLAPRLLHRHSQNRISMQPALRRYVPAGPSVNRIPLAMTYIIGQRKFRRSTADFTTKHLNSPQCFCIHLQA